ncbi:MAG: homoprotocatechuate degradation operon regulator HpaR [Paracoccaceae bacterium]
MTQSLPSTSRSLPIALLRARERVMGPIRGMLASVDITEQQWRVLRVLQENGPMEPTRISEEACLLLPSLTRILQKLEEKGMIQRERDSMDRRKQIVKIAQSGEEIIATNLEKSVELSEAIRQRMGPDDYDALLNLLNKLEQSEAGHDQ